MVLGIIYSCFYLSGLVRSIFSVILTPIREAISGKESKVSPIIKL